MEQCMEKPMQLQFSAIVRRDDPIVSDHRIHGVRIMPGVCFFDMIYRFLKAKEVDPRSARLENILFLEPVTATEDFDCNVRVAIEGCEEHLTVLAKSRPLGSGASPGEWRENLKCEIRLDAPQWKGRLPVDRLQREARRQIDLEEAYRLTARMDILHGPFMKAEGRVFEGSDYFLAEVHLNRLAETSAKDFFLHPVHLDAATAVLALLHPKGAEGESRPAIPFHIESFQAVAPLQGVCFVYVKKVTEAAASGDVLYSDLEIYSPEGAGLARFQRFAAKRIREKGLITRLERGGETHAGDAAPRPRANSAPASRAQCERASSRDMEAYLREVVAHEIHKPSKELSIEAGFYSLGLDSVGLLNIVRRMEEDLGRAFYPTLLFEYQCIRDLAGYLSSLPDAPAAPAIPAGRDEGPEENASHPELLYFTPVWKETPACGKHDARKSEAVASGETGRPSLLALGMDRGVFDALESRTDSPFHGRVALALPGDAFLRRKPGVFEFNPAVEADYFRLLDELEKEGGLPGVIIHALPVDVELSRNGSEEGAIGRGLDSTLRGSLFLVKALMARNIRSRVTLLHVWKSGGAQTLPFHGALAAFGKTAGREDRRLLWRDVEIADDGLENDQIAALLLDELRRGGIHESSVSYRSGKRRIERLMEAFAPEDGEGAVVSLVRKGGVYLITGGSGRLGKIFADCLASRFQAKVALCGTSAETFHQSYVENLRKRGADAAYFRADLSDPSQVEDLLQRVRARFGPINGILHCAGVVRDSLIVNKSLEEAAAVVAPKVRGTIHLDRFTREDPLDFFALFSSTAAIVGNRGQSDYAYANAFMDGFAHMRENLRKQSLRRGRAISVNWPLWRDGGMRVDAGFQRAIADGTGMRPLSAEGGVNAFFTALAMDAPQVVVAEGDAEKIRRFFLSENPDKGMGASPDAARVEAPKSIPSRRPARHLEGGMQLAVIGVSGRYPMAENLQEFWENLKSGRDCITEIPPERWDHRRYTETSPTGSSAPCYARWGGFLKGVDRFDPLLFQISPREAELMDPQERLFLETVWEVIEDAGYRWDRLTGERVGVFAGVMWSQYGLFRGRDPETSAPIVPEASFASVANRASYFFNFTGPSFAVDAMCSSSLVAVQLACESILRGESSIAVAGGVNLTLHPSKHIYLCQCGFASTDGRCRSFGAGGDGYAPSEGAGAVLIKPLERAVADRDHIYGVIRAAAVSHGGRTSGYSAPSPKAQAELIKSVMRMADVDPRSISYIEAHGAGTALGDPIEMQGLVRAMEGVDRAAGSCAVGSVKSNIGHAESAAGIAALAKVLLQMRHKRLAPSLHAEALNPHLRIEDSPFRIQRELAPWERPILAQDGEGEECPRRAGISSFGAGGANAHVIVEEYEEGPVEKSDRPERVILPLSAADGDRLRECAESLHRFLSGFCAPQGRCGGPGPADADASEIRPVLFELVSSLLGVDAGDIRADDDLCELGLGNVEIALLAEALEARRGVAVDAASLAARPTIARMTEFLSAKPAKPERMEECAPPAPLRDVAYTLQTGRVPMAARLALTASGYEEAVRKLSGFLRGESGPGLFRGDAPAFSGNPALSSDEVDERIREEGLDRLAAAWVEGVEIDWERLYAGESTPTPTPPRRTPLPTYPFARERCWLPGVADVTETAPGPDAARGVDGSAHAFATKPKAFLFRFTGEEFFFLDHRLGGRKVLPAAASIEMIRAAGERAGFGPIGKIIDMTWERPVTVDDGPIDIEVRFFKDGGGMSFRVTGRDAAPQPIYAHGRLQMAEAGGPEGCIDIPAIRSRCQRRASGADCLRLFSSAGFHYGPGLSALAELRSGEREALAELVLPEAGRGEMRSGFTPHPMLEDAALQGPLHGRPPETGFFLHPALVDGALQATIAFSGREGEGPVAAGLPYSVDEIVMWDSLRGSCHAYVTLDESQPGKGGARRFHIKVADDAGKVRFEMRGLTVVAPVSAHAADSGSGLPGETLYFKPEWRRRETPRRLEALEDSIVFADGPEARESVAGLSQGGRIVLVEPGENFKATGPSRFAVRPDLAEDWERLFRRLEHPKARRPQIAFIRDAENTSPESAFLTASGLVQGMRRADSGLEAEVLVVHKPDDVAGAAMAGFARSIMLEEPRLRMRCVATDSFGPDAIEGIFRREFGRTADDEARVHYEGGVRRVLTLEEMRPATGGPVVWKPRGVYLITGGAGGLGAILARHLARTAQARLVLCGRSRMDSRIGALLDEISNLGGEGIYVRGDVTLMEDVEAATAAAKERFHRIDGVIHAAGAPGEGAALDGAPADRLKVLAPKMAGAIHLDQFTQSDDLDCFVLFSSVASVLGAAGQADYAFANGCLDRFAVWRTEMARRGLRRGRTVSINWPLWRNGGMRPGAATVSWMREALGMLPMGDADGLRAFEDALRFGGPQVVALHGHPEAIREALAAPSRQEARTERPRGNVEKVEKEVRDAVASELKLSPHRIERERSLASYGLNSVMAINVARRLETVFGKLPKTLLFEATSIGELVEYFNRVESEKSPVRPAAKSAEIATARECAPPEGPPADVPEAARSMGVAVVGMSGRHPGSRNLEEFWENLKNGRDCVTEIPPDRWALDDETARGLKCRWGGFLEDIDKFDPLLFRISPVEAEILDPQARLFLEIVWEALEDAGCSRAAIDRMRKEHGRGVGVFAGSMYLQYPLVRGNEGRALVNASSYWTIANRVSYFFNLTGPSMAIDAACASSLTAIHMACESIRRGESIMAIAGGVNLNLHPDKHRALEQAGMIASARTSRSMGRGDGFIPAEGVGAVVLKPLELALRDGDRIYGVIRASAVNHGGTGPGFATPSLKAQADLIIRAFKESGIPAETVAYVEAATNGSSLGDPMEIAALTQAFRQFTTREGFCPIGSVKSNMGHMEAASGVAQLAKVLLQIKHGALVPTIYAKPMNPAIELKSTPFVLQERLEEWKPLERSGNGTRIAIPRRALINSFGAGGSNACLIVEEHPVPPRTAEDPAARHLFPFSAANPDRMRELLERMLAFLEKATDLSMRDMTYTLQAGREALAERLAVVARSREELAAALRERLDGRTEDEREFALFAGNSEREDGATAFLTGGEAGKEFLRKLFADGDIERLAALWASGAEIDWSALDRPSGARKISLPLYPFERRVCWPGPNEARGAQASRERRPIEARAGDLGSAKVPREALVDLVASETARLLKLSPREMDVDKDLREYGFDSLLAVHLVNRLHDAVGRRVALTVLLRRPSIRKLASHLAEQTEETATHDDSGAAPSLSLTVERAPSGQPGRRRGGIERIPLSEGQKGIWTICRMQPKAYAYNLPVGYRIRTPLDIPAMERALARTVDRHPLLKAAIVPQDGEPVMEIDPARKIPFTTRRMAPMTDAALGEMLQARGREPFDMEKGPLARIDLYSASPTDHALSMVFHHIIFDGMSLAIFVGELGRLYEAEAAGQPLDLPPVTASYADFVSRQAAMLASAEGLGHRSFWRSVLSGEIPELSLPVDTPAQRDGTLEGEVLHSIIDRETTARLRQAAAHIGVNMHSFAMAAFLTLLHRYTGQEDLVVGVPYSGRSRTEYEPLVGYFANMLPARLRVDARAPFSSLAKEAMRTILEAMEHGDYPFARMARDAADGRGRGESPIFRAVFGFQNRSTSESARSGLKLETLLDVHQAGEFDLMATVAEDEEGQCLLFFKYHPGVFDKERIGKMSAHYRRILDEAASRPEQPAGALEYMTPAEKSLTLEKWSGNGASCPEPLCIHELFEKAAAKFPDNTAIIHNDRRMTYRELNRAANRIAHMLVGMGVRPESRVGIRLEPCVEMIAGIMGILKAGGAYVPIDVAHPYERSAYILEDAGVEVLLTEDRLRSPFENPLPSGRRLHVIALDAMPGSSDGTGPENPSVGVHPQNLAYVMYTSGSTGKPKGVMNLHANVPRVVRFQDYAPITEKDVVLQLSNYAFDGSVLNIFGALLGGAALVLADRETMLDMERLGRLIRSRGITVFFATTALYNVLIDEIPECLAGVRKIVFGGEQASAAHVRKGVAELGPGRLVNGYGPTECTVFAAVSTPTGEGPSPIPIGKPITETEIYILDREMRPVAPGVEGEIYIGGKGLARGYLNRPDLTAERFVPHPFASEPGQRLYRTGDAGAWLPDGSIRFLRRVDGQVKLRGFRVEMGEIEQAIKEVPGVREALVLVRDEGRGNKSLAAFATPGTAPGPGEIRKTLANRLPDYMVPAHIARLDGFPMTTNGKVDREALLRLPLAEGGPTEGAAALNETEEAVLNVWREALGARDIDVRRNFFEAGGDSLLLVKVHARLNEKLGIRLAATDLFRFPTVEGLARFIRESRPAKSAPAVMRCKDSDSDAVAVVGMACRFPGADDIDAFWRGLERGEDSVSTFTDEELESAGVSRKLLGNPNYVRRAGLISDVEMFDADFFGFTPVEAAVVDPQQRLFLEHAFLALEHAGCDPNRVQGGIGVYAGAGFSHYLVGHILPRTDLFEKVDAFTAIAFNDKDFLATRTAYKLNLKGPAVSVQSACSTSLVAIHFACEALMRGECGMALAGGVSLPFPRKSGYLHQKGMILSATGKCRPFDASADGTVMGNGVGVVVLKRLSEALRDGDAVHAVIRGSAVNNDGSGKVGFSAPGVDGQTEVIERALRKAGVSPDEVSYIETHGTGTPLGDPIEFSALRRVFGEAGNGGPWCALGSVKANIGHLDAAAGVASFIKTVLALERGVIPPSPWFRQPNPRIEMDGSPFFINTGAIPWKSDGGPRRAGVSSFGMGGSNAHVVLEEAAKPPRGPVEETAQLLVLSARTPRALELACLGLADHLERRPDASLADAAFTLQMGRNRYPVRKAIAARNIAEAAAALRSPDADPALPEDLGDIARRWLGGEDVDWKVLHKGGTRRKIPLPGYPLERQKLWIDPPDAGKVEQAGDAKATIVPDSKVEQWLYRPEWVEESGVPEEDRKGSRWLIFRDPLGIGRELARKLTARGDSVISVTPGDAFQRTGDREYALDIDDPKGYEGLIRDVLRECDGLDGIVHLCNVDAGAAPDLRPEAAEERAIPSFFSLFHLIRALASARVAGPVRWLVAANGLHKVLPEDATDPVKSLLLGPCRVIPMEFPLMSLRSVDIGPVKDPDAAAGLLMEELRIRRSSPDAAHRSGKRWIRAFRPVESPPPAAFSPRAPRRNGVYLITGGLGGIGLSLARHLAETVQARLVLTGRRPFPDRSQWKRWLDAHGDSDGVSAKIRSIMQMEALGAEVVVESADVASRKEMEAVVRSAVERFGRIDGAVHCAGAADNRPVSAKEPERARNILSPKVAGTLTLNELLRGFDLDFFVSASSLASVLGGVGMMDYAAANAFLDAFALHAPGALRAASIGWDAWSEVGMGVEQAARGAARTGAIESVIGGGIGVADGVAAFGRILALGLPHVVVSTTPLENRLPAPRPSRPETGGRENGPGGARIAAPRPNLPNECIPPATDAEKRLAELWEELLGIEGLGSTDNYFDLGGHSLLATRMIARVSEAFGADLMMQDVFESPTIRELAGAIERLTSKQNACRSMAEAAPPAVHKAARRPLSFAQERLWFLEQFEPGNANYNNLVGLRLLGRLDRGAIEEALRDILRRHEALRTTFTERDGKPVQIVIPWDAAAMPPVSLEELPADAPEEEKLNEARAKAAEMGGEPFRLDEWPLLRLRFLKLGPEDHILLIVMHHIISDGWSMTVFGRELTSAYAERRKGREPSWPPLPIQYADFAERQKEQLERGDFSRHLDYWKRTLENCQEPVGAPTDFPRPRSLSGEGRRTGISLDAELTRAVRRLGAAHGCSPFMTLLAAVYILLRRYAGATDICIGSPAANRDAKGSERLIGFFVNTLALRIALPETAAVSELLREVRRVVLDAYAHQDIPFEKVVEALNPGEDRGRTPFFRVMFDLWSAVDLGPAPDDVKVRLFETDPGTAKFDLTFSFTEAGNGISGWVEYASDLFASETMDRMTAHLLTIVKDMTSQPEKRISHVNMLGEAERTNILAVWNRPSEGCLNECLHRLFEKAAANGPDRVAITWRGESVTYRELNERANQTARYLIDAGVGAETTVGICMGPSIDMIVALLGTLKAGGACVPIDPGLPMERARFMLADSATKILIGDKKTASRFTYEGLKIIALDGDRDAISRQSRENPEGVRVAPDNLAYVIYTSGSTGTPKGVMNTHANAPRIALHPNYATISDADSILQLSSFAFDGSIFDIFGALLNGARLVIADREDAMDVERLADLIERERISVFFVTTAMFNLLTDLRPESLQGVRTILFGGEKSSFPSVRKALLALGPGRLVNVYGPTECTVFSTHHPIASVDERLGVIPIGRPITDTRAYILDNGWDLAPVGATGEIAIAGEGLCRGYLNRPDLTAGRFIPDPFSAEPGGRLYLTGDVGKRLPDGSIQFLERRDNQVKLRGFRIEPGEIEAALHAHPAVRDAVVCVREDEPGDKRLVAYMVASETGGMDASKIREDLSSRLPGYMVPSDFMLLDALPMNRNGKVERSALPAPPRSMGDGGRSGAPRTETEKCIARIWSELLHRESVGIHDDFFHCGGHSLLATQAASRIREALDVALPLRMLFDNPTVAALAGALRPGETPSALPSPAPERGGAVPLSYAQERLWLLDQLEPASDRYNIPGAVRILGRLRVDALQKAFDAVILSHEGLRTVFEKIDGGPRARTIKPDGLPLLFVDLKDLPVEEREEEALRRVKEFAALPFRLDEWPLLRAAVMKMDDEEHVLAVAMHHIISDGWSLSVLLKDLSDAYGAAVRGEEPPRYSGMQYSEYAERQRKWLDAGAMEQQLAYWRKTLEGAPDLLSLPTDFPRPALQGRNGKTLRFEMDKESSEGLRSLCLRHGATPFMGLLAAAYVLLSRCSNETDVCIGAPIANRSMKEAEGLIGFLVNTLVMRIRANDSMPFVELLRAVRRVALDAYDHQDAPFEKVVEALNPERALGHSSLFQVALAFQNLPEARLALGDARIKPFNADFGSAKFDLAFSFYEDDGKIIGLVEYCTDLFRENSIRRMTRHFTQIVRAAAADENQPICDIDLLTESEKETIIGAWSHSRARTIPDARCHEMVEEQARRQPGQAAVVAGEERATYGELNAEANRLARELQRCGVGPEKLAAVVLDPSLSMIAGMLGVMKAGGAYVPIDPAYPAHRIERMLRDAAPDAIVTDSVHAPRLRAFSSGPVILTDRLQSEPVRDGEREDLPTKVHPGSPAYVIYTSGSTGVPKGTVLSHEGLSNLVQWQVSEFDIGPSDRMSQVASFGFDAAVFEVWPCLCAGATLEIAPREALLSPRTLQQWLLDRSITFAFVPTPMAEGLFQLSWPPDAPLRCMMIGGDRLKDFPREPRFGFTVVNNYGPTENTVVSTFQRIDPAASQPVGAIGRPIDNATVYVLDCHGRPVPEGVPGELHIGGPGLARGYLGRADLTAANFIPDCFSGLAGQRLYKTGDLVRWLPDGVLEFLGRIDRQVKVRGFRVELGEIEAVLREHPDVESALVVSHGSDSGNGRLAAYVAARGPSQSSTKALKRFLSERLPAFMVPAAVMRVEAFPLTPNGKVDFRALPAPVWSDGEKDSFIAPKTAMEQTIAHIWRDVLDVESVGVRDNFFDAGGNSLLLVKVHGCIEEALSRTFPIVDLFRRPTIEALCDWLCPADGSCQTDDEAQRLAKRRNRRRQAIRQQTK